MEFENSNKTQWQQITLGAIIQIIGGGTPKTSVEDYWNGHIPWLSVKDFNNEYRKVFTTEKTITQKGLDNSSTKLLNEGDIIISARGTVGELAILGEPMAFNQSCYGLRANKTSENGFIYYLLKYKLVKLKSFAHGSVFDTITTETLKNLEIVLPPLPQQQKIASILSALDDKIELNNQMNQTLETMAKALFKSWFVDFEPFADGEFEASKFGMIPKGWRIGVLSDLLLQVRKAAKVGKDTENKPYVPIDCINSKQIALTQYKDWQEAQSSLIKFEKNDILFGAMRPYFHKVTLAPFDGITRTTCFILRPENLTDLSFCLIKVFDDQTIDYANRHSAGSTMPYAVWENGLANMPIIIPLDDARNEFHRKVFPLLEKIRDSIFEIQNLMIIRDSLLPKLMSGEINLNVNTN